MDRDATPTPETEERVTSTPTTDRSTPQNRDDRGDRGDRNESRTPTDRGRSEPSRGSFLDDADDEAPEEKVQVPANWPADWREKMASGDEKTLGLLKRMQDPSAVIKSYKALQQKLSSGEYVRKPLDDATPEELEKFREEIGVPKTPLDYEIPEVDGYEWTEQDEPYLEALFTEMHSANAPQPIIDKMLGWYGKFVEQSRQHQQQIDAQDRETQNDNLRAAWGNDFKSNKSAIKTYLTHPEHAPDGLFDKLAGARTADGRLLLNQPGVAEWLADLAISKLGAGSQVWGDARTSASSRQQEIEKILQSDPDKYFREGLDKEYADLLRKLEPKRR